MGVSFLTPTPSKSDKTFSFRNSKPVLIFTADKPKENLNEKENNTNCLTDVKKKVFTDIPYMVKENIFTEGNINLGKNRQQKNDYYSFFNNGKKSNLKILSN
jgi:hypothetical protein